MAYNAGLCGATFWILNIANLFADIYKYKVNVDRLHIAVDMYGFPRWRPKVIECYIPSAYAICDLSWPCDGVHISSGGNWSAATM